jgi:hypothetical protein
MMAMSSIHRQTGGDPDPGKQMSKEDQGSNDQDKEKRYT